MTILGKGEGALRGWPTRLLCLLSSLLAMGIGGAFGDELPQCRSTEAVCAPCQPAASAAAACASGQNSIPGPASDIDAMGCPRQCAALECMAAVPQASQRLLPLTENPHPWEPATIRRGHPRLYVDAARLQRLRSRWNDPAYASIVKLYRDRSDPLSLALRYLATGQTGLCPAAAAQTMDEPYKLFGPPQATYGDTAALVLDWCFAALTEQERAALVGEIELNNGKREAALDKRFQWHEAHYLGLHAYLLGVLAIEGEPGAGNRLQKAENVIQNVTDFANEVHGDGTYKTYSYQDLFFITPAILWSVATGEDVVRRNQYIVHRPEVLLRLLSAQATDFTAGPGDQAADGRGMVIKTQRPSALGPLIIAGYLHDGLAQYTGELIRAKQGWSRTPDDPQWLALLYFDDKLGPTAPAASSLPLVREMPVGGMVNARSAWNIGAKGASDIVAWFYAGPRTEHSEPDAGHFTISRADDDLIVSGANYFGSPSEYKDRWGARSFSRNTMVFSPAGSTAPDSAGSQIKDVSAPFSAERYPISNRLIWYPAAIGDGAALTDFRDLGDLAIATGDVSDDYDSRFVTRYTRTFIYVRPNVFIIRDQFALHDVDRIRLLLHLRQRPEIPDLRVVQGTAEAGILEGEGDRAVVIRGQSEAVVRILSPNSVKVRAVGGPGYESYIDGSDIDPSRTAQSWLMDPRRRDIAERIERTHGQWRIEFETTPARSDGEIITAIVVGAKGFAAPAITLEGSADDRIVAIKEPDRTIEIHLPLSDTGQRQPFACRR